MTDRDAVIDLLTNPDALRKMFDPNDPEPPPAREMVIDIPEAHPLPSVECNVEIRLTASFDPWQISGVPYAELQNIVWALLTDSANYGGGIRPVLTFVNMTMERKPHAPTTQRTSGDIRRDGSGWDDEPDHGLRNRAASPQPARDGAEPDGDDA